MYLDEQTLSECTDTQNAAQTVEDFEVEHILLPNLVDQKASSCPETVLAEYPESADTYKNGYRAITYWQFANAINGAAWWLEKTLGHGQDFETLAYIGPNDVRYQILLVAAIKVGYKVGAKDAFVGERTKEIADVLHVAAEQHSCAYSALQRDRVQNAPHTRSSTTSSHCATKRA